MRITAFINLLVWSCFFFGLRFVLFSLSGIYFFLFTPFDIPIILILLLLLLNLIVFTKLRYSRWKYVITPEHIDVVKGFFKIKREIVPITRIQKIDLSSGPIDRLFHLSNIEIITAAGSLKIRFIHEEDAVQIAHNLEELLKKKLKQQMPIKETTTHE